MGSTTLEPTGALGFEGDRFYVVMAATDSATGVTSTVVQGLALPGLQTVASYPVPEVPHSMAVVDGQLVFGARTELVTATPACP